MPKKDGHTTRVSHNHAEQILKPEGCLTVEKIQTAHFVTLEPGTTATA
jgi:hypothetical protein